MKKILLFLIPFLLTGCYDFKELDKISIINALSIDYIDNQYNVTIEIIENIDSDSKKITCRYIDGYGKNLTDAFYNIETKLSNEPFYGHLEMIIIGDEITNNKFDDLIDFILRSPKINSNIKLISAKSGQEIIKNENEYSITSNLINDLINNQYNNNTIKEINFENIVNNYLTYGINPVIPYLIIYEDNYQFTGMKVLNSDIYFNEEETYIYNILTNNVNNINLANKDYAVRLYHGITKYNFKNNEINIKLSAYLIDNYNNVNFNHISNEANKLLEERITNFIKIIKEKNVDILGINHQYYLNNNHKKDIFKNYEPKVNVNLSIEKYGLTRKVNYEK